MIIVPYWVDVLVEGKLAGKMKSEILRWIVVTAGLIAAVAFFVLG